MTESELYRQQLSELGLCGGDVVMVHSSMKALGDKAYPRGGHRGHRSCYRRRGYIITNKIVPSNVRLFGTIFL